MTRSQLTRVAAAAATAAVLAVTAGEASAAQRYAAPGATNAWPPCPATNPCSLKFAIEQAGNGDEVILLPGDYGSPYQPLTAGVSAGARDLTIRGRAGEPKPRLWFSTQYGLRALCTTHVRDIELHNQGFGLALFNNAVCSTGQAVADRVAVYTSGYAAACRVTGGGILRNSICHSAGGDAVALSTAASNAGVVRNVTAVGTGAGSTAIRVEANSPNQIHVALHVLNTIARADGKDVVAKSNGPGKAELLIGYSNFADSSVLGNASVIANPSGSLQSSAPLFANGAAGDLHQLAGSPTVDAGVQVATAGTLDIDGQPRLHGAAMDIGADELAPAGGPAAQPPAGGQAPAPGAAPQPGSTAGPLLANVSLTRARWPHGRRPARVRFQLGSPAHVSLRLARLRRGRRPVPAGSLVRAGLEAGAHSLRLPRGLEAGRYALRVIADAGDTTARSRRIRFRVVAG